MYYITANGFLYALSIKSNYFYLSNPNLTCPPHKKSHHICDRIHFYSISKLSLLILSGKTRDRRMNKIAGINHGSDAPDNGRKLMMALSPASLKWLPITLSKAISVTTATVICIPGLDKATNLLAITIITIVIVIG